MMNENYFKNHIKQQQSLAIFLDSVTNTQFFVVNSYHLSIMAVNKTKRHQWEEIAMENALEVLRKKKWDVH